MGPASKSSRQHEKGKLKIFVDELPLSGKLSVFVTGAPNAVGAKDKKVPAIAATTPTANRPFIRLS